MPTLFKRAATVKLARICAITVLAILLAGIALLAYVYAESQRVMNRHYDIPFDTVSLPTDSLSIVDGGRLATIRGCNGGCHGKGIEGKVFTDTFMDGVIVAPNLTQVARDYSIVDLVRVIRHGVRPDGTGVIDMPSAMFYNLSDGDLGRILAFVKSRPQVSGNEYKVNYGPYTRWMIARKIWLPWPEDIKEMGPRMGDVNPTDTLRYGEYLVRTSCTECHGNDFAGDPMGGTPNLAVVAAYSKDDFARLMREGIAMGDRELGLMSQMARTRFTHLTTGEVESIRSFLRQRITNE